MRLPILFVVLALPALSQAPSEQNQVEITQEGDLRRIRSNGIPDHATGRFPNAHNPNSIRPQNYNYTVPLKPEKQAKAVPFLMQPFGVALNGIVFDPFAAEWWRGDRNSGWQYEPQGGAIDLGLDDSNAHVQPDGSYHYHGIPHGLLKRLAEGGKRMTQLGWAADGFPIYGPQAHENAKDASSPLKTMKSGYRVKQGQRPEAGGPGGSYDGSFVQDYEWVEGQGDLDENNGRFGVTPEFPQGTYYYVLTEQYPFIPRQFAGKPDASFERRGPPRGPGGFGFGPPGFGPPPRGRRGGAGFGPPPPPPPR